MKNSKNHINSEPNLPPSGGIQGGTPPRLAEKLLLWFLKDELAEEVLGDLDEKFYRTAEKHSTRKAKRNYWFQVINYMRPFAFRKYKSNHSKSTAMFKHNLLISFRSFQRYKSTFLINLFGLATGLASALLIYLWVYDELNTDRFNEKDSNRHVQVIHTYPTSGTYHTSINGSTPNPLFEELAKEMPEIDYAFPVAAHSEFRGVLSAGNRNIRAKYQFIGKGYFNAFPGNFLFGNKHQILTEKGEVAISEKLATTLFNSAEDAMGKLVDFKDEGYAGTYMVTGVFKATENNSANYDMLFSFELYRTEDMMQWYNSGVQAHLILNEGVDLDQLNAKLETYLSTIYDNWKDILYAQPYSERYLYGKYENGKPLPGRIQYVKLFSAIAIFVLVIACINYMNFSTANASRRIKEIGVKKAIGASRKALVYQYFGESVSMALLSLLLAIGIAMFLLPQFNSITGKELTFAFSGRFMMAILSITLLTGILSGVYPALMLSGFNPVVALKGKLKGTGGSIWLRKGLVIFQFAVSFILIVSVLVVYKQVEYIQTTNLGYDREHIITFPKEGKLKTDFEPFLTTLRNIPGVVNASQMSGNIPGDIAYSQGYKWEGMTDDDKSLRFYQIRGGYELIDLLGIELKDGRTFSREFPTDVDAIILNEAAVEMTQLENPVGQKFGNYNPRAKTKEVIGVVKDFHFQSLQEKVRPFFFSISDNGRKFIVKLKAGTERETIDKIESAYTSFNEGYPFEFRFLDDDYQAAYAAEERVTALTKYFAGIAITISCLGLLALTAFSTQRRFKEIAIRKVLGSTSTAIARLLSQEFVILVLLAILIALPISYYFMRNWLDSFAYRIELKPLYFILGGVLMMVVAWLTIASQTAKSAKVNITESLRSE
ncbi:FtsX-like permease family protein [Roseivirga thermotolerans]|uniref:FtsX-like permease family protein n=1 Tax=Roseivirga thermotolerans TaxID=1758176 RepID=UPI00273DDD9B|nr:FtsX-like permease family protein [Roseivirga thermotolerans]